MRGEPALLNGVRTDKNRTEAEARRDRFAAEATRDTKAVKLFGAVLGGVTEIDKTASHEDTPHYSASERASIKQLRMEAQTKARAAIKRAIGDA